MNKTTKIKNKLRQLLTNLQLGRKSLTATFHLALAQGVYIILIMKVMPFPPPPALSVDSSQERDSKREKNLAKTEKRFKT
jgi:hypothetical protein